MQLIPMSSNRCNVATVQRFEVQRFRSEGSKALGFRVQSWWTGIICQIGASYLERTMNLDPLNGEP